jgi:hypothetical protein
MSGGVFTLADLAAALTGIPDPTGTHPAGVPILPPASALGTFPAILLAPEDDTLEAGKVIRSAIEVTVLVGRANQTADYVTLDGIYRAALDRLAGSSFTFGGPFRFAAGGPPDSPPYMARVIPVSFVVGGLCPTRPIQLAQEMSNA